MKPTFAHTYSVRLLQFYPRAWRERYAEEVAAVLQERPATWRTLLDLVLGAVDAHLHPDLFSERQSVLAQRLRFSQIIIYCCAICFNCLLTLYCSQQMFWYPGLVNQHEYHVVMMSLNACFLLLMLSTLLGSLVFIGISLKHSLTNPPRTSFFIWSLASAMSVTALSYGISQVTVPVGSSPAVARLMIQLPNLSNFLTLLSNEVCLALVFVGIQQLFKKQENQLLSSLVWGVGVCIPLILVVINYRTTVYLSSLPSQDASILVSLLVFGSLFLQSRCKRKIVPSVRLTSARFIPLVLMTLTMNVLVLIIFLEQIVDLHGSILYVASLRDTVLHGALLFMALLTLLSSLFLWRGYKAQQARQEVM